MSNAAPARAVFDCTIFTQALINPKGPAGKCLFAAQTRRVKLFVSEFVLDEIRELPGKIPPSLGVTPDRVEGLIIDLAKYAEPVTHVPPVFVYQRDPDDAHYVNLALAARAVYVVSRDNDLLDLMDATKPEAAEFARRFPELRILDPKAFLLEIGVTSAQPS